MNIRHYELYYNQLSCLLTSFPCKHDVYELWSGKLITPLPQISDVRTVKVTHVITYYELFM